MRAPFEKFNVYTASKRYGNFNVDVEFVDSLPFTTRETEAIRKFIEDAIREKIARETASTASENLSPPPPEGSK